MYQIEEKEAMQKQHEQQSLVARCTVLAKYSPVREAQFRVLTTLTMGQRARSAAPTGCAQRSGGVS